MLTFRDLRTFEDVKQWLADLNSRRPERTEVMQHISHQLKALPFPAVQVVELCAGPGQLAAAMLTELPQINYTGLDASELLLAFAREQLAPFGSRATLIQADLNQDEWLSRLPSQVHAVVSLQSLHDLGGEVEVSRIYRLAKNLLVPGGLLLNADLVVPPGSDDPEQPGRRSIPRHLELLRAHGYERGACTIQRGELGCVMAFTPSG